MGGALDQLEGHSRLFDQPPKRNVSALSRVRKLNVINSLNKIRKLDVNIYNTSE